MLEFVFYAAMGTAPIVGIVLGLWHVARDVGSPLLSVALGAGALAVLASVVRDILRKRFSRVSKVLLVCWGLSTAYVFIHVEFLGN